MTDEIRAGNNGREDKALDDDIRTAYGNMEGCRVNHLQDARIKYSALPE
jgi:hypothetical protein